MLDKHTIALLSFVLSDVPGRILGARLREVPTAVIDVPTAVYVLLQIRGLVCIARLRCDANTAVVRRPLPVRFTARGLRFFARYD